MRTLIAHLDADCFYVACERFSHPHLVGRPVAVLSSLDAFVIARSYELKPFGVKVGTPVWECRKLAPQTVFLPADFALYGKMSRRIFEVVRDIGGLTEVYSIDEAFTDLTGLDRYYNMTPWELGELIKRRISEEVGLTVSVGIGETKTIAKLASDYKKPDGLFVADENTLHGFLADRAVDEICGIGGRLNLVMERAGIRTALDFYNTPLDVIKKWLGKHGMDLWFELHGHVMSPIHTEYVAPKSVSRTSNYELKTTDPDVIFGALSYHALKVIGLLVTQNLHTSRVGHFLRKKDFTVDATWLSLAYPTNEYAAIIGALHKGFWRIFRRGVLYRGSGVMSDIDPRGATEPDLFGEYDRMERSAELIKSVATLNKKYGKGTLAYLCTYPYSSVRKPIPYDRMNVPIVKAG